MIAARLALSPIKTGCWLLCMTGLVALVVGTFQNGNRVSKKLNSKQYNAVLQFAGGRKAFPFSVIRGGAYSPEELNRARRLDSVVRAHYASFGRDPVVQKTPKDLLMYVSYRKSDVVYWTRTKRRIPKGELVLSENGNMARARCGNRLSFTPQQPVSREQEPTEEALNTPETPEISAPFEAPPLPVVEAALYAPAGSLPTNFLSQLPLPSPLTPSQPAEPLQSGGMYAPMPGWGTGSMGAGGAPLGIGGVGLPIRNNASSGAVANTLQNAGNPVISTPEPATVKLLLFSALIVGLLYLREKLHLSL